ncbi:UNVERIFIED_CONTAM: Pnkp [Trichonephila clavipes]
MPVFDPVSVTLFFIKCVTKFQMLKKKRNLKTTTLAIKTEPPPKEELNADNIISPLSEVIVFVGFPAGSVDTAVEMMTIYSMSRITGKTHFVQTYLIPKGYIHINRDTLGSWQKCVSECSKALSKGQKVVIDNTNPDIESRSRYIQEAKKFNAPCRCFLFDCSLEQAKHNNVVSIDNSKLYLSTILAESYINLYCFTYRSKYKEPSMKEGFSQLVKVNFVPKFKSKHEEKLFRRFLIEK